MSASQQVVQVHSEDAWRVKKQEVDNALVRMMATDRSAAYIQAAHGTGKSTTLLLYALGKMQELMEDVKVIYVAETELELSMAAQRLCELNSTIDVCRDTCDSKNYLTLCTYYQFIEDFKAKRVPYHHSHPTVIICDVQLRPSTHAVVFSSILLKIIEDGNIKGCIFLAAHLSAVTVETFEKVCKDFVVIQMPDNSPEIKVICVGRVTPEQRAELVSWSVDQDPAVVSGESLDDWRIHVLNQSTIKWDDPGSGIAITNIPTVLKGAVAIIDATSPSVPIPNLRMVLSSGTYTIEKWDVASGQIVTKTTRFTKSDLDREKSWLRKAGGSAQGFCLELTEAEMRNLHTTQDPWCPAWNGDIMWTVLSIFSVYPNEEDFLFSIPLPAMQDRHAVAETIKRLVIMGCIEDNGNGSYSVTKLGGLALSLRDMNNYRDLDLHVAMFFARASNKDLPVNVRRVIIRLAAIIAVDVQKFIDIEIIDGSLPPMEILLKFCAGVGHEQANKGRLWIALGVWLKQVQGEQVDLPPRSALLLCCDEDLLSKSFRMVGDIEDLLRIPLIANANEVESTTLSRAEVEMVEQQLVLCYMTRVMRVDTAKSNVNSDVASHCPLQCQKTELLDMQHWKEDPTNKSRGVFYAIYLKLSRGSERGPRGGYTSKLEASGLVYMPAENFLVVEDVCGKRWPSIAYTSYPLRSVKD